MVAQSLPSMGRPPRSVYSIPQVKNHRWGGQRDFLQYPQEAPLPLLHILQGRVNGGFKEATDSEINLSDEDPVLFEAFFAWLYTGSLYEPKTVTDPKSKFDRGRTDVDLDFAELTELWVFGDKRRIPKLQNDIIDAFHRYVLQVRVFSAQQVNYIYSNDIAGARLGAFVVEAYARIEVVEHYAKHCTTATSGGQNQLFVMELCRRYQQDRPSIKVAQQNQDLKKV